MKQPRKLLSLLLAATITFSLAATASAAFLDFTDVKGHWAEKTLSQAYSDGILKGSGSTTMSPNSSVTTAQAVTMLCRVLHVTGQGDTSGLQIPQGAWYTQDAAKAVYAGLLDSSDAGKLDLPIARKDAFVLFDKAFQITEAQPDLTVLDQFPDAASLTGQTQRAAAALVQAGVISGSEGKLQVDRSLTRAEFATILYRLADQYASAASFTGHTGSGSVLSGDASLSGIELGKVWFDQSASNISLTDIKAQQVTVRSDKLKTLGIAGTGEISRLVLAAHSGDVMLDLPDSCPVNTVVVGDGGGTIFFSGTTSAIEITGQNRTVNINCSLDTLLISGNDCSVVVKKGCSIGKLTVLGTGNTVQLNGTAKMLLLANRDNTVNGSGRVNEVLLNTRYYTLTVSKNKLTKWEGYDISNVNIDLTAPAHLAAGQTLKATAQLTVPEADRGKVCTGTWYLNGEALQTQEIVLGKGDPTSSFVPNYTHNMKLDAEVKFILSYQNNDGDTFTQEDSALIQLETFSDLGLADAVVHVTLPDILAAGQTLKATAHIETPEVGQVCKGTWYVDGKEVSSGSLTLGGNDASLSYRYDYYYGMPTTSKITYRLTYTTRDGRAQEVSGEAKLNIENFPDNGIARASASLTAPATLEAGKTLEVTAKINYPEAGKVCTGTWYVDGTKVATQTVILGKDMPKLSHKYKYTENMKLSSEIKFVLSYTTADGRTQSVTASKTITLKNYDYLYYHGISAADVLKTVTSNYAGDYTLAWAQSHDYSKEIKTAWVNLQGYKSNTKYLVWVNLTYQRVNIFEGSQGNWKLIRTCLCGSGKSSTPTIRGVFTTSYKQSAWNYGSYYCGPIVRFNGSSGYAFHSRLEYWPMNSDRYYDARIGFPISHGCLRMYNDDIWFMYNNIPNGTTVVVY